MFLAFLFFLAEPVFSHRSARTLEATDVYAAHNTKRVIGHLDANQLVNAFGKTGEYTFIKFNGFHGLVLTSNLVFKMAKRPVIIPTDISTDKKDNEENKFFFLSTNSKVLTGVYTTGYYPDDSPMEGGYFDCFGNKLRTLQEYYPGSYVSLAVDPKIIPLRSTVYIDGYTDSKGNPIKFWACDVGGAIKGLHVDICTANAKESSKVTKYNQVLRVQ